MAPLTLLASLLLAFGSANACTTSSVVVKTQIVTPTVVQTATSIIPGSTSTPTITATPSYSSSSSSCVGWECGSTSCIPSTTSLLEYVCDNTCLNKSTFTYTTTTYPPPITATIPCKFAKRAPEEEEFEKRWTCVQGPTITSTTSMACSDCKQFPTLTTTTKSSLTTIYTSACGSYSSSSSSKPTPSMTSITPTKTSSSTKTPTPTINPTGGCWYMCYNSAGGYTTIPYTGASTATPSGYVRCLQVCS